MFATTYSSVRRTRCERESPTPARSSQPTDTPTDADAPDHRSGTPTHDLCATRMRNARADRQPLTGRLSTPHDQPESCGGRSPSGAPRVSPGRGQRDSPRRRTRAPPIGRVRVPSLRRRRHSGGGRPLAQACLVQRPPPLDLTGGEETPGQAGGFSPPCCVRTTHVLPAQELLQSSYPGWAGRSRRACPPSAGPPGSPALHAGPGCPACPTPVIGPATPSWGCTWGVVAARDSVRTRWGDPRSEGAPHGGAKGRPGGAQGGKGGPRGGPPEHRGRRPPGAPNAPSGLQWGARWGERGRGAGAGSHRGGGRTDADASVAFFRTRRGSERPVGLLGDSPDSGAHTSKTRCSVGVAFHRVRVLYGERRWRFTP